jgi:hypothetical protein
MQQTINGNSAGAGALAHRDCVSLGAPLPGSRRLHDFSLDDTGQVFDACTGRSYTLDPAGQVALLLMREGLAREVVIAELARRCDRHPETLRAGIDTFLSQISPLAS